jgi:hypothetical protein
MLRNTGTENFIFKGFAMNEPSLKTIEDYNTLSGEKRRIVWAVIIAGLIIGGIYTAAKIAYGDVSDEVPTAEKIGRIPVQ